MLTIRLRRGPDGTDIRRDITHGDATVESDAAVVLPGLPSDGVGPGADALQDREAYKNFGQRLFSALLGEAGRRVYEEHRTRGLSFCFLEDTELPEAAGLPWEMLHDGREYAALNPRTPFFRRPAQAVPAREIVVRSPLRCLLFWSAPTDQGRLKVETEMMRLAAVFAAHDRADLSVHEVMRCTREKLRNALEANAYDLVYFTGHGGFDRAGMGCLCLENGDGSSDLLGADEFSRMLGTDLPALVVLNCCQSGELAGDVAERRWFSDLARYLLVDGVHDVVGTSTAIYDVHGRLFAEAFLRCSLTRVRQAARGGGVAEAARGGVAEAARGGVAEAVIRGREAVRRSDGGKDGPLSRCFHQFLHFSAVQPDARVTVQVEPPSEQVPVSRHHVSGNYPDASGVLAPRHDMTDTVEGLFRRGNKTVGVCGLGGLGKSTFSVQLEKRLGGHYDPALRIVGSIWLDLRDKAGIGEIIHELARILDCDRKASDFDRKASLAKRFRDMDNPEPVWIARQLVEAFPGRHLLTLDNCESLLQAAPEDWPGLRGLLAALCKETPGWPVLLTSRERFFLEHEGRGLAKLTWRNMEELGFVERQALFWERERSLGVRLNLSEGDRDVVISEIAGHPYELDLFFRDARSGADCAALVKAVHEKTEEYARLEYYLDRLDDNALRMLRLLSLFYSSPKKLIAIAAWRFVAEKEGWPEGEEIAQAALATLRDRGFVADGEGEICAVPPVIRYVLTSGQSAHTFSPDEIPTYHGYLAHVFGALFVKLNNDLRTEIKKRVNAFPTDKLSILHSKLAEFLHQGIRHAIDNSDIKLIDAYINSIAHNFTWLLPKKLRLDIAHSSFKRYSSLIKTPLHRSDYTVQNAFRNLSVYFLNQREFNTSFMCLDSSFKIAVNNHRKDIGSIYHTVGMVYEEQRDWEKALQNYQNAIKWNKKTGQKHELGGTYHQIGTIYQEQRDWKKALQYYLKAIEWNKKTGQEHRLGGTYHQIGTVFLLQYDWNQALQNYQKAIEWYTITDQENELGGTYHQVGGVYQELCDWENALQSYHKAIKLKSETGQEHELGATYHQIGMVYHEQRDWDKALQNYHKAIEWKSQTGQEHELGATYHQIGIVYQDQRDWEKALQYYHKSIKLKSETGQEHKFGGTYHQIGYIYEEQRDWEKALQYYRNAIEWNTKTGQEQQLGATYHQIGWVYQEQREWEKALQNYQKSIERYVATQNQLEIWKPFFNIGIVFEEIENFQESLDAFDKSIEMATTFNGGFLPVHLEAKARVLRKLGRADEAALCDAEAAKYHEEIFRFLRQVGLLDEDQPE